MEDIVKKGEGQQVVDWGYDVPQDRVKLIRENLKVIEGFDEEEVLTGHILERILGDDVGAINTALLWFDRKVKKPEGAVKQKEIFSRRIDWELDQEQTPQKIKEMLKAYVDETRDLEWDSQENVASALEKWRQGVYSKVLSMVRGNEDGLGDADNAFRRYEDEARKRGLNL